MSVDIKLARNRINTWANIFALSQEGAKLWHGDYGDRIPAVFLHNLRNKLHICNSVSDDSNHCWNSDILGTDWFNLRIGQRKENEGYVYEIFLDGNLEYSVVNTRPEVFSNVRAEFANAVPNAAVGEFRNFQLSTNEPVENRIDDLVAAFRQMLNDSNLRPGEKQRIGDRFQVVTRPLIRIYRKLNYTNRCYFPLTSNIDADHTRNDSCQAVDDIMMRVSQWGTVFNHNCRREQRGEDPLKGYNRVMRGPIGSLITKARQKLQC